MAWKWACVRRTSKRGDDSPRLHAVMRILAIDLGKFKSAPRPPSRWRWPSPASSSLPGPRRHIHRIPPEDHRVGRRGRGKSRAATQSAAAARLCNGMSGHSGHLIAATIAVLEALEPQFSPAGGPLGSYSETAARETTKLRSAPGCFSSSVTIHSTGALRQLLDAIEFLGPPP
jgi:hypothetical protein